jgi:uncharacterized SAM-binding protein YcdF (DUF218 family)
MQPESLSRSAARGVALFLGGFSLLNLVGGWLLDGFDATALWIGLRRWGAAGTVALACATLALLAVGLGGKLSARARVAALVALLVALAATAVDALTFFSLWRRGVIEPGVPVPLSIVIGSCLVWIAATHLRNGEASSRRPLPIAGVAIACALALPLAQMGCFGRTDYRRRADAAVVFGARAYADGRPSDALADRVRTGCRLYADGYVRTLVFSGGPGDGAVHETESMRRMALAAGVPDHAIVLDAGGTNTEATVRSTVTLLRRSGARRVLAVSHGYHSAAREARVPAGGMGRVHGAGAGDLHTAQDAAADGPGSPCAVGVLPSTAGALTTRLSS